MTQQGASETQASLPSTGAVVRPLRPFQSRPVFVIVGMHRSGASILARMLQLLGVDMAEGPGSGASAWERDEIVAFNDRLLEMIGRPLNSAAHALPFPPGWWADPAIRAVKRDVQAYLRNTLQNNSSLWGFKDLRITRLLPFWQQVFDEMGLQPVYLWTVREPAECASSTVSSGLTINPEIAEAMWFIYNADAHKFIGGEQATIIDYASWSRDPEEVVKTLLRQLPLTWRGSQAELLECIRAIAPDESDHLPVLPQLQSPLVRTFYESLADPQRSESSLRYRSSVAQAVDILRTLVSPYAALIGRVGNDDTPAPPSAPPAETVPAAEDAAPESEALLRREIEARVSENIWLHQQYLDQKRACAAMDEQLHRVITEADAEHARLAAELTARTAESRAAQQRLEELQAMAGKSRNVAQEEIDRLRRELDLQKTANEKYLARIYELKATQAKSPDHPAGATGKSS